MFYIPRLIATAGHIDHGKSSLVRALGGSKTDRTPEERRRGMTIHNGFTSFLLSNRKGVGVIDVPGHIDYIRNMIAAANATHLLLLVVAADDGIMPQTREHIQIAQLLKIPQIVVALTKFSSVTPAHLSDVREKISRFLVDYYPEAPIVAVDSLSGEGIENLRDTLTHELENTRAFQQDSFADFAFRMQVFRVFTACGHGTIATGIVISGAAHVSDHAVIRPSNNTTTVRSIENYNILTNTTVRGPTNGLNLTNLKTHDVNVGDCVCAEGFYDSSDKICVRMEFLPDRAIPHNSEGRLYIGAAHTICKIVFHPFDTGAASRVAVLHLKTPLCIAPGDRFILRKNTPSITLAGGYVLSIHPPKLSLLPMDLPPLSNQPVLNAMLYHSHSVFTPQEIAIACGVSPDKVIQTVRENSEILNFENNQIVNFRRSEFEKTIHYFLAKFHEMNPLLKGAKIDYLALKLKFSIPLTAFILKNVMQTGKASFSCVGNFYFLRNFSVVVSKRQQQCLDAIMSHIQETPLEFALISKLKELSQLSDALFESTLNILITNEEIIRIEKHVLLKTTMNQLDVYTQKLSTQYPEGFSFADFRATLPFPLPRERALNVLDYLTQSQCLILLSENKRKHRSLL